ncbi:Acetyltransferase (GNAT) domain [Clostridium sp. ASBs410]|nr:Acetyltransferase (GNAT) domain [Clostridium sp. ASBs410]
MSIQCNLILAEKLDFQRIYEIIHASIPPSGRRSYDGQHELVNHHYYKLYLEKQRKRIIAFLAVWEFNDFNYTEHFAVEFAYYGNGLSEKVLEEYLSHAVKPVFSDGPPLIEIARRRIKFYERIGFHLNKFDYWQPAL